METCIEMYDHTATGLSPEIVHFKQTPPSSPSSSASSSSSSSSASASSLSPSSIEIMQMEGKDMKNNDVGTIFKFLSSFDLDLGFAFDSSSSDDQLIEKEMEQ